MDFCKQRAKFLMINNKHELLSLSFQLPAGARRLASSFEQAPSALLELGAGASPYALSLELSALNYSLFVCG
jgi:hypothetical protein